VAAVGPIPAAGGSVEVREFAGQVLHDVGCLSPEGQGSVARGEPGRGGEWRGRVRYRLG
jgi:hypothetical protein